MELNQYKDIGHYCLPALISVIFTILSLIGSIGSLFHSNFTIELFGSFVMSTIMHGMWSLFIEYLCLHGHESIAWILLVLPLVLTLIIGIISLLIFNTFLKTIQSKIKEESSKSNNSKPNEKEIIELIPDLDYSKTTKHDSSKTTKHDSSKTN